MHHQDAARGAYLEGKVAVADGVHRIGTDRIKPEFFRFISPVGVIGGAAQRARADRGGVHAPDGIADPSGIPDQHPVVSKKVLCEQNRLCPLQMRISGQNGPGVFFCLVQQRPGGGVHRTQDLPAGIAKIEPQIKRHLVVSASCRMQSFPVLADPRGELLFDEHMDVFRSRIKGQPSRFQIAENVRQPPNDPLCLCFREDPLFGEHFRMSDASPDILPVHFLIEPDRRIEIVRRRIRFSAGPSCSKLHIPFNPPVRQ